MRHSRYTSTWIFIILFKQDMLKIESAFDLYGHFSTIHILYLQQTKFCINFYVCMMQTKIVHGSKMVQNAGECFHELVHQSNTKIMLINNCWINKNILRQDVQEKNFCCATWIRSFSSLETTKMPSFSRVLSSWDNGIK